MNNFNYKNMTPFKWFVLENFPFIENDFESINNYRLFSKVVEYLNKMKDNLNLTGQQMENLTNAMIELQNYVNNYFDNLDVQDEINNKLDEMAESGELSQIISMYLNIPNGNSFDAQRIGRKIIFGTNPNSTNYNSLGIANGMQGGCVIDENTVAYMLWDNININLNKNKLVKMNINTGEIINEMDFNFGWCNSMAYKDGLFYIAVRGTTNNSVATNNGYIKVINATTLLLENEYTLPINVNAISIYDNTLYVLQENTNTIYLYNLDGTSKNETINLSIDILNIYNQNIKVSDNYIYLISTQPSNLLNVFMKDGTHVKAYNVPKYGGLYKIGELQWLDILNGNDMILASSILNYEETINQFFKINLVENISTNKFIEDYTQLLYVNSEVSSYNPNGTIDNPFNSINECDILNVENIIVNANNKNYKYTHLHNHKTFTIRNAILTEGIYIQNGKYILYNTEIDYSINSNINACTQLRDCDLFYDNCIFDAKNNNYCIFSERYNNIKFISPSFINYTLSVFSDSAPSSVIELNGTNNIPYLPRTYGRQYNLMSNGIINQYKTGTYNYNTNLNSQQIEELFNNAQYIIIGYVPLNHADIREIKINKNNANSYTIVDSSVSSGSVNLRVGKMIATINKDGIIITSNTTTSILSDSSNVTNSNDSSLSELFIQLRYVKLMIQN